MLDPDIAKMLQRIREDSELPPPLRGSAPRARERADAIRAKYYRPVPREVAAVEDRLVPGPGGALPVRVYRPAADGHRDATVVYLHGGRWVLGGLDSHDGYARRVAHTAGAVVVSVGYRLAPEHPFPAAYDDAVAAVTWAWDHIAALGGNRRRLAVAGDSAGGNLAAGAALHCRDAGIPLAGQLLSYPPLDLEGGIHGVYSEDTGANDACVTGAGDHWAWEQYLGGDLAQARDPRVSPLHAGDFARVAPAVIGVGSHDWLRAQCRAYAEALERAGVPVTFREYPGLVHAFFGMGTVSPAADLAADELCRDLGGLLYGDG